jgi:4-amino-4-deoxy-L-arabinose transferase-like glycosyltransferase
MILSMINALRMSSLSAWFQLKGMRIRSSRPTLILFLITTGILIGSLIPRLFYAQIIPPDYDEGVGLMFGMLATLGHTPYTETFVGIPPLALLTIQLGVTLFGDSWSVRYPMMLYSLMGIITLFWLVKQLTPHKPVLTGLLASTILSFSPRYLSLSATILTEVPAIALALVSLALVEYYRRQPLYRWLILSGIAFALSLMLKIFVVFLPVIIGLQLLTIALPEEKKVWFQPAVYIKLIKMGLLWLSGILIVLGLFSLLYDPAEMYHEVITFRTILRDVNIATENWLAHNIETLQEEIELYVPLMITAILGLWLGQRREDSPQLWIWPVWFILAALLFPWHIPLRPRHLVILLPPLAVLSGLFLVYLMDYLSHLFNQYSHWVRILIFLLLLGYFLFQSTQTLASLPDDPFETNYSGNLSAVAFVQRTTFPNDCIIVDDQRFAFQAGRLVPPFLSETSRARLQVGWVNAAQIIETDDKNNCAAIVMLNNRFDTFIPELRELVRSIYALTIDFHNPETKDKTTVYTIKINIDQQPTQPINRSLGGQVTLKGVDLTPTPWRAGQIVTISSYWLTEKIMERDYKIFLHLCDAQGNIISKFDHYPFELGPASPAPHIHLSPQYLTERAAYLIDKYPTTGLLPTRLWIPNNILKETMTFTLPTSMAPGNYTLKMGMYDETSLERLAVINDTSGENAISLGEVRVQE